MSTSSTYDQLTELQKKLVRDRIAEELRNSRLTAEAAAGELLRVEGEIRRRVWAKDPEAWCREKLHDFLWSGQRRILQSIRDYRRTAVPTCHEIGKSFIAGRIASWWIDSHKHGEAFVVTTAPTAQQVRAILWKEIGRAHTQGKLDGRVNQTEWLLDVNGKEELVAFGRKPSDYSPAAFQGIHAPYVLVIVDEANGVSGLWEAIDSVIANDDSKIIAIGNPDVPAGEFYEACKPGSGWNVVQISAFDSPNFTGEKLPDNVLKQLIGQTYVEEKRRKWASQWRWVNGKCEPPAGVRREDANPFWLSKVLGEFPTTQGDTSLIPLNWIRRAQELTLNVRDSMEVVLGCDVGGGGDSSCIAKRIGGVVRVVHEDRNPDTMATCGNILALMKQHSARVARVDEVGIGRGVVDRAKEVRALSYSDMPPVVGINVGSPAYDEESYENRRAELYWTVRTHFENGTIDIDSADDDLAAELASIRYERTSRGKIKIESKKDAKSRGVPSPNRADALMLSFADALNEQANEMVSTIINETPSNLFRIPMATTPASIEDLSRMFGR